MNPYQVLGVSQTDDEDIIKKAYRKAAKECHPDTHPGDKRAEERFKEIGEAYRILSDKQKRKEGAPEDRFIREISKRNLNDFFPKECRARRRKTVHRKK